MPANLLVSIGVFPIRSCLVYRSGFANPDRAGREGADLTENPEFWLRNVEKT